jgi:hypothetical protein
MKEINGRRKFEVDAKVGDPLLNETIVTNELLKNYSAKQMNQSNLMKIFGIGLKRMKNIFQCSKTTQKY